MTFEQKKFNEVFKDMQDRALKSKVITDFEVGSVARTLYESFAYEIALLYEKMQLVYLSGYVDTAQGQQLDMVVSVLGIKRGLPDFAEGVVTFVRDVGKGDIEIPIGTLVATEDKPESPKKVYQTIESKILAKDRTSVDVKVQAVNRGEEEVTPAETIVVMPRPIPGIKSVTNPEATRFTGKRRETDEELRERAKNALISSGKATILSIENALFSLPGVKDVKVKENFQFAQGKVTLTRGSVIGDIAIPKGTHLSVRENANPTPKTFKTTEPAVLIADASSIEITVQALKPGKEGEVTSKGEQVVWQIEEDDATLKSLTASSSGFLLMGRGEFGIIEVFVDGIDFSDSAAVQRLQDEIDRVRAAGIFVLLKSTTILEVDGIFKIEINPDLKLSQEDRAKFETTVRDEIIKYIDELRMGQPLLFSQIIKNTLSLDGINNLEEFAIAISKKQPDNTVQKDKEVDSTAKRIDIEEFERFKPRHIRVASETKNLPVYIQFKVADLTSTTRETLLNNLRDSFKTLDIGVPGNKNGVLEKAAIQNSIQEVIEAPINNLKLLAEHWYQPTLSEDGDVSVSFIEQVVLGNDDVFAYEKFLKITGALKLTLPATVTDDKKQSIQKEIKDTLNEYLEKLKPETDLVFRDLIDVAKGVDLKPFDIDSDDFKVEIDYKDCKVTLSSEENEDDNDEEVPERISKDKIEVRQLEKPKFDQFCISSDVEIVSIEVTKIDLDVVVINPQPNFKLNEFKDALKNGIKAEVKNLTDNAKPGQDLAYNQLKTAIQNRINASSYTLRELRLKATSLCDERLQETSLATAKDIHVRSVELPTIKPINEDNNKNGEDTENNILKVKITVVTLPTPPSGGT